MKKFEDLLLEEKLKQQNQNYNDAIEGHYDNEIKKRAGELFKESLVLEKSYNGDLKRYTEHVLTECHKGNMDLLITYMKDDRRQNIDEKTQYLFIDSFIFPLFDNEYYEFNNNTKGNYECSLPNSQKNAIYCDINGNFGTIIDVVKSDAKTMDARLIYRFKDNELTFYFTLKYTNKPGGSQNHQLTDVETTNKMFIKNKNQNIVTLSVLDGAFYQRKNANTEKCDPISYLNNHYGTSKNHITTSNNLFNIIKTEICNWLKKNFDINNDSEAYSEMLRLQNIK